MTGYLSEDPIWDPAECMFLLFLLHLQFGIVPQSLSLGKYCFVLYYWPKSLFWLFHKILWKHLINFLSNPIERPQFAFIWYFLMMRMRVCILGKNITEMVLYPQCSFQGVYKINVLLLMMLTLGSLAKVSLFLMIQLN